MKVPSAHTTCDERGGVCERERECVRESKGELG